MRVTEAVDKLMDPDDPVTVVTNKRNENQHLVFEDDKVMLVTDGQARHTVFYGYAPGPLTWDDWETA